MVKDFESDVSYANIFPSGEPFKSLYAIHCLRDHIATHSKQVSPSFLPSIGSASNLYRVRLRKTRCLELFSFLLR
jgi:hypothetical protein